MNNIDAVKGISGAKEVANDSAPAVERRRPAPRQEVMGARQAETAADQKRAEQAVREMQSHLSKINTKLRIEVDSSSHDVVVKVVDGASEEVIRQIPSEEFIAIKRRMEELTGLLYDSRS